MNLITPFIIPLINPLSLLNLIVAQIGGLCVKVYCHDSCTIRIMRVKAS